jgi:hypothetical protein
MKMDECRSMDQQGRHVTMTFHTGYCETVLLEDWKVGSVSELVGSMIGIFSMVALYESQALQGLPVVEDIQLTSEKSCSDACEERKQGRDSWTVHMVREVIYKEPQMMFGRMYDFQTFLQIVLIVLNYILMLIMMHNVWPCVSVIIGTVTGYFL